MSRLKSILLGTALALVAGVFSAAPAVADHNSDHTIRPWPGSEANRASYWEDFFGPGWDCTKVSRQGPFTTQRHWDAIILKGGQWNNIYMDVPSGTQFTEVIRGDGKPPAGISHWFKCKKDGESKPPSPELKVRVKCVEGGNGVLKRLLLRVFYDTDGQELTLRQKIRVNGQVRIDSEATVQGSDTVFTSRFVGRGDHRVTGFVRLGELKRRIDKIIHCAPILIVKPKAEIKGPFGDPEYFARFINRRSNVDIAFIWRFVRNGDVVKLRRTVGAGDVVRTGCKVIDPGTRTWINYIHPVTDERVRLVTRRSAPLDFYPACPV